MNRKPVTKPLDFLLIAILVIASVAIMVTSTATEPGAQAVVYVGGEKTMIVPLDVYARYEVEGKKGLCTFIVDEYGICMIQSPCPHHFCIQQGYINMSGQSIVCVPNEITIRVIHSENSSIDGITG